MLVSLTEYSRHHGVSKPAVTKWKKGGFLVLVDNKVDLEESDKKLREFKLGKFSHADGDVDEKSTSIEPAQEASVSSEQPPDEERLRTVAQIMSALADNGLELMPYDEALRFKENYLALLRKLEYETKNASLISLDIAESVLFEEFRAQRDAWLNWPTRVGPMLAVDLGLDAARVTQALTTYVHQHIAQLGEAEGDFAGTKS